MKLRPVLVIAAHAIVGWALCGAIIGIGRPVLGIDTTLIVHAIAVPLIFGGLSWLPSGWSWPSREVKERALNAGRDVDGLVQRHVGAGDLPNLAAMFPGVFF